MSNSESSQNESNLDKWIQQNLQSGSQPVSQEIVHEPAPKKPHTANTTNKPPQKRKPFFRKDNRPKGNRPQEKRIQKRNGQQGRNSRNGQIVHKTPHFAKPGKWRGKLRVIPLGGLNEIGRNCMALEYENDIIIIDMGFQFPEEDFLGVDYVLPDISYLENKAHKIRGIIFTHGHLDHIGAVEYLIPKLNYPVMYGTQLTMSFVQKRLKEAKIINQSNIKIINDEDILQLGPFNISFFNVIHSIPDAVGVCVKTPAGNIVHTGDFKFDLTPSGGQKPMDFTRISSLAHQDIAALFIDSTNATKPGHTISEKRIGESLDSIVKNAKGRLIIASFASQIGRLQQIINIADKYGRKVLLSGRSLEDNFEIAKKIGYLRVPQDLVLPIHKVKKLPDENTLILTTGSQGEMVSALHRMSIEEHSIVKIKKGDTVILSSTAIPGNERAITTVINNLARLGANIINNQIMDVHASGHGQQEDLKLMMSLVRPKTVVPVHGEYFMRIANRNVAVSLGYSEDQTLIIENGDVLVVENNEIKTTKEKVETKYIMVDGLGVGDIGAQVIMDRQTLAENGVLVVMIPVDAKSQKIKGEIEIISRGFIYMKESEQLIKEIAMQAEQSYRNINTKNPEAKHTQIKNYIRESVDKFIHEKIERYPLILPVIVEK